MKKKFKIQGLDCANCARELEEELKKIKGVNYCSIAFLTEKIIVEADDEVFEEVMDKICKTALKFEDGVVIVRD